MAAVQWEKIEPYFVQVFEATGQIERQDVIDLAFAEDESDDVIDAIDAIGSRVFRTVEDAKNFLKSQNYVTD
jgi:hypothetical protein